MEFFFSLNLPYVENENLFYVVGFLLGRLFP